MIDTLGTLSFKRSRSMTLLTMINHLSTCQLIVPDLIQNHRALTFEHLDLGNRIFKPSSCKLIFPLKSLRSWNLELMKSIWDNFRGPFYTLTTLDTWYLQELLASLNLSSLPPIELDRIKVEVKIICSKITL